MTGIRCDYRWLDTKNGETQTKCAASSRVTAMVVGVVTALVGALILAGVIPVGAVTNPVGGTLVGVGALLALVGYFARCSDKNKNKDLERLLAKRQNHANDEFKSQGLGDKRKPQPPAHKNPSLPRPLAASGPDLAARISGSAKPNGDAPASAPIDAKASTGAPSPAADQQAQNSPAAAKDAAEQKGGEDAAKAPGKTASASAAQSAASPGILGRLAGYVWRSPAKPAEQGVAPAQTAVDASKPADAAPQGGEQAKQEPQPAVGQPNDKLADAANPAPQAQAPVNAEDAAKQAAQPAVQAPVTGQPNAANPVVAEQQQGGAPEANAA